MQKTSHPESTTAFIFEDTAEVVLGVAVAQHLPELVPGIERSDVDCDELCNRLHQTLNEIIDHTKAPQDAPLWGEEARVMIDGLQALAAGKVLAPESDLNRTDHTVAAQPNLTSKSKAVIREVCWWLIAKQPVLETGILNVDTSASAHQSVAAKTALMQYYDPQQRERDLARQQRETEAIKARQAEAARLEALRRERETPSEEDRAYLAERSAAQHTELLEHGELSRAS